MRAPKGWATGAVPEAMFKIAPVHPADHPHLRFRPGHDRDAADAALRAAFDDPVAVGHIDQHRGGSAKHRCCVRTRKGLAIVKPAVTAAVVFENLLRRRPRVAKNPAYNPEIREMLARSDRHTESKEGGNGWQELADRRQVCRILQL
jgi:hypothetical protein